MHDFSRRCAHLIRTTDASLVVGPGLCDAMRRPRVAVLSVVAVQVSPGGILMWH
jgi:hypothetical protein